jgi:ABC-type transporter Mla maintaining outer membrane lipid asymmetry permease subunit MlaE
VTAVVWSASVIGALLIIVFATWILGSVLGLAGASVFKESSVREIILGTDRDRFVSPLLFAVLWAVVAGSIAHVLLSRARRG